MTNTIKFLTALSVGGVLISTAAGFMVVNAQSATATNTSYTSNTSRGHFQSQIDAVRAAIESKDYTAWKIAIATDPNGTNQLAKIDTQDKFDQLIQAHEYMKTNEPDKAKAIFDTLGIQLPGRGMGRHGGKMGDPVQQSDRKAEQDALDSGDYNAWKTATATTPNGDQILAKVDTQEKFTQLSEAHKAVKTAHEAQQKVQTELGLDDIMGPGTGKGKEVMKDHYENFTSTNTPTKAN